MLLQFEFHNKKSACQIELQSVTTANAFIEFALKRRSLSIEQRTFKYATSVLILFNYMLLRTFD